MELTKTKPVKTTTININGTDYTTAAEELTGAQIKELGHVPAGETLFQLREGHEEKRIEDTQTIKIKKGLIFESSPDGAVS